MWKRVGVPMTILCNIHEMAPESLSPEAAEFLARNRTGEALEDLRMGNYNSFKFVTNANTVIKRHRSGENS